MAMATPMMTNGFIMPSTIRTNIGAAQHRQQARPPPQTELSGKHGLAEVDYADPPSPEW
jgi:hypothetical protein